MMFAHSSWWNKWSWKKGDFLYVFWNILSRLSRLKKIFSDLRGLYSRALPVGSGALTAGSETLQASSEPLPAKAGRYSIGIVLPTQNWTILGFPNIGFTSQYNTNTIKKVVDEEEEEEENQIESSRLGQIDGP